MGILSAVSILHKNSKQHKCFNHPQRDVSCPPTINQNNIPIGPIVNRSVNKNAMIGIPELYRRIVPYVARPLMIGLLAVMISLCVVKMIEGYSKQKALSTIKLQGCVKYYREQHYKRKRRFI